MRLLDEIVDALRKSNGQGMTVDVFNVWNCRSQTDFATYLPGLSNVLQSPVTGQWRDGQLLQTEQGYAARDWIARRFGSSSQAIVDHVTRWREAQRAGAPTAATK
jgi:hypothetical protein